ncbi:hypothetical protein NUU61_001061 [Penicillium alfredii]|uniref:Myb-like DNA-binding domain-containing protein n=1 Tax=Penicillium alfredii TaxID=1506179 RepID=A0A9W9GB38_9EURO|nr:uncharacterized protein NUU61_001061 [Penicillium alfredii]KAJ5115302.1 hypothetical protein NUU61_001061 [Penicillium alfredii]
MPPSATEKEQIGFLVNCIKNTHNGKVDWEGVASDLNIISKAAASKRYSRLLQAYELNSAGEQASGTPTKAGKATDKSPKDKKGKAYKVSKPSRACGRSAKDKSDEQEPQEDQENQEEKEP